MFGNLLSLSAMTMLKSTSVSQSDLADNTPELLPVEAPPTKFIPSSYLLAMSQL